MSADSNKATVHKFFACLEGGDMSGLVNLFADDGVQINPYTAGIFPTGAVGRAELLEYWEPVPDRFDGMKFVIEFLLATEESNFLFSKFKGEIKLRDNQGYYRNNYYSTFRFNDEGKITEYVEIFDPLVAAKGLGLLDQVK